MDDRWLSVDEITEYLNQQEHGLHLDLQQGAFGTPHREILEV
jgi:hypothetical protein